MRKVTISLLLIVGILWTVAYAIADNGIDLDPVIESHLQEEFNTRDLSREFALSVEELNLSNLNLISAKGLEHFKNLKKLNISQNVLTDSSFLKELDQLEELDVSFNQFTTIELTSPHLVELNVQGNRLKDIEFIRDLNKLVYLNLRANNIVDLSPLANLTKLQYLNVRGNQVKLLDPLKNLSKLTDLNIRNNQIHSIEPIVDLPLTERLTLTGNDIEDLTLLEDKIVEIGEIDFEIGVPRPTFSVESGVYAESFMLEMESEDDLNIYYTLDGSMPNINSPKYEGPVEISKDIIDTQEIYANLRTSPHRDGYSFTADEVKKAITVTAIAESTKGHDKIYSEPVTSTYIFDPDLLNNNLPIVAISSDPINFFDDYNGIYVMGNTYNESDPRSGNYYKRGREFEKEAIVEFFDKDGMLNFKQNIGVRINGNYTRRLPQKSLRLYARSDYGQSRFYTDVFQDHQYNEFNRLVLRNSGNDYDSTLLRDGLMHELVKDGSVDVQAYQPAIVLLNGEYWGIHNIREKFTKHYIDIKYNLDEDDLVMMTAYKDNGLQFEMDAGGERDKLHYENLIKFVEDHDMTSNENLEYVETLMDLDNFLEYVAYQVYFANTDSFGNNLTIWRKNVEYTPNAPHGHDGRWRWMLYDLDWGMGYGLLGTEGDPVEFNMIEYAQSDSEYMTLFRNIIKNENAKERFIEKLIVLLNTNFKAENVKKKIDELSNNIRPEIANSISRWENIESVEKWEENIQVLYEFAEKRPKVVIQHIMKSFNLTEEDLKQFEGN